MEVATVRCKILCQQLPREAAKKLKNYRTASQWAQN
jgi:hypothetical protein